MATTPGVPPSSTTGLHLALPALEIYQVDAPASPLVRVVPTSDVAQVVGGAEAAYGRGAGGSAAAVTRDVATGPAAPAVADGPRVLTDTPARREVNFGIGAFGASQTLTPEDPLRIDKKVRDYGASDRLGAQAVARLDGARSITASSSASDADAYPVTDRAAMPYAAFDGDELTEWRPNPVATVDGAWLEADFGRSVDLSGGRVLLDRGTAVRNLGVVTDEGEVSVPSTGTRPGCPTSPPTPCAFGSRTSAGDPRGPGRPASAA